MNIIMKTKVKKKFNQAGIQINLDALNLIDSEIDHIIDRYVRNCGQGNGNVRRVTATTVFVAFGRLNEYFRPSRNRSNR